jgi:hypothetical protein
MEKALITGITGQNRSYLAGFNGLDGSFDSAAGANKYTDFK